MIKLNIDSIFYISTCMMEQKQKKIAVELDLIDLHKSSLSKHNGMQHTYNNVSKRK